MCEFIAGYEDSKLLKKRTNKLAWQEEEEKNQELEKPEEQPLLTSN